MSASNRLSGRTAIVTGGSQGIGRATAMQFAREGAQVVVADVNAEAGTATAEAIADAGGTAQFVACNVADRSAVDALIEATLEAFGTLDILVNNAGITRDATLKKMDAEAFRAVIEVNLEGVFHCTQAAYPHLSASDHGRVLNAASVVGLYGNFGQTNYVASKSGVIGMTRTWAREFGRDGITVNAVAPGFIDTPMVETVPDKVINSLTEKTPLGRLGTPADIANAYTFLASDEAAFITGAVLSVDGGLVM